MDGDRIRGSIHNVVDKAFESGIKMSSCRYNNHSITLDVSFEPEGGEPLDICRHLDFNTGNAIKYLLRKDKVDGNKTKTEKRIEDLRKAVFYIQDEIKLLEHGTD